MSPHLTLATAGRILKQILRDTRTVALVIVAPLLIITLLYFLFDEEQPMVSGLMLYGIVIFPITLMFLLTAIATVRERISGTLERLMTTPIGRGDILGGYALAFGLLATVQVTLATTYCYTVLGMEVDGPTWAVFLAAMVAGQLGVAFGLLASAVSQSEFQAVQIFPALIIPQLLLCGILGPRENMADWLETISDYLPITYAAQAAFEMFGNTDPTELYWRSLAIAAGVVVGLLAIASATLKRRTS